MKPAIGHSWRRSISWTWWIYQSGPFWMVGSIWSPGWSRHGHHPRKDRQGYEHRRETTRWFPVWPHQQHAQKKSSIPLAQVSQYRLSQVFCVEKKQPLRSSVKRPVNLNPLDQPPQDCRRGKSCVKGYCYHRSSKRWQSSLLNNLLREEKAIVTDIEEATRRYREYVNINRVPPQITVDTAGIRDQTSLSKSVSNGPTPQGSRSGPPRSQ